VLDGTAQAVAQQDVEVGSDGALSAINGANRRWHGEGASLV
jgi:hypothetical protein